MFQVDDPRFCFERGRRMMMMMKTMMMMAGHIRSQISLTSIMCRSGPPCECYINSSVLLSENVEKLKLAYLQLFFSKTHRSHV